MLDLLHTVEPLKEGPLSEVSLYVACTEKDGSMYGLVYGKWEEVSCVTWTPNNDR